MQDESAISKKLNSRNDRRLGEGTGEGCKNRKQGKINNTTKSEIGRGILLIAIVGKDNLFEEKKESGDLNSSRGSKGKFFTGHSDAKKPCIDPWSMKKINEAHEKKKGGDRQTVECKGKSRAAIPGGADSLGTTYFEGSAKKRRGA